MLSALTTAVLISLLGAAAICDVRTRRIPNALTVSMLVAGLALRVPFGVEALLDGGKGVGVALLLGIPLFALRALGGGDVKLIAALGAFTGPLGLFVSLVVAGIAGGVLALAETIRRGMLKVTLVSTGFLVLYLVSFGRAGWRPTLDTSGAISVPYGVAIAVGGTIGWFL